MEMIFLIVLAGIMAVFGVIGYQRGTRFSLMITGLIWAGLLVMGRAGNQFARLVNGLYFGVRFALAGGLSALGGTDDKTEAIKGVMTKIGSTPSLIAPDQPELGLLLFLAVLVGFGLLLGRTKFFKGASSALGLVLGLANGYVIAAVLIAMVAPELALLPLPFGIGGNGAAGATAARSAVQAATSDTGITDRVNNFLNKTVDSQSLPAIIVVAIALFIIFATRFGNRGGKKG